MLLSLNFKQPHDTIHKASRHTCYKNAVLGVPPMKSWASRSEVAEHKTKMTSNQNFLGENLAIIFLLSFKKRDSKAGIFIQ